MRKLTVLVAAAIVVIGSGIVFTDDGGSNELQIASERVGRGARLLWTHRPRHARFRATNQPRGDGDRGGQS